MPKPPTPYPEAVLLGRSPGSEAGIAGGRVAAEPGFEPAGDVEPSPLQSEIDGADKDRPIEAFRVMASGSTSLDGRLELVPGLESGLPTPKSSERSSHVLTAKMRRPPVSVTSA